MTISSLVNRVEFTGNGATRAFSFPYHLIVKADLKVYLAGVLKTLDTHYTITGTPSAGPWPDGVTVTFPAPAAAPATDASIVIIRDPAITQGVDLVENDGLPVEDAVEQPLDRLTMIAQRLSERADRSFVLADTDISGASTELPTPAASKLLGWDATGLALTNYASASITATIVPTAFMETLLDDADAATARATLGSTSVGDALFIAASAAAGRTALGLGSAAVEPTTTFWSTGDVKLTLKTAADTGWVLMDDGTIGNAASGGTTRANADTETLFTLLWTNTADAQCAVSTGRGASAAADYAANKTIALPKALGRALATYGSGSGLTARALALATGTETHALTEAELAAHVHAAGSIVTASDGAHTHTTDGYDAAGAETQMLGTNSGGAVISDNIATTSNGAHTHAMSGNSASTGSGDAHPNMQPTLFLNVMIKL